MRSSILLLGACAAGILAFPTSYDYVVHERRDVLPRLWSEGMRLDPETSLPVRIGLTQSNLDRGHDLLMEVSNPDSPRYGQHYSVEEVHDLFAPSNESVDSVRSWLESAGIASDRISQSMNKQWLQFDADAGEVERLLRTEYYIYEHGATGKAHVACREYHVPKSVREHIDYITPGIKLLEVSGVRVARRNEVNNHGVEKRDFRLPPILQELTLSLEELLSNLLPLCGLVVTPPCIEAMYNITKGSTATPGNELGIFEDLGDVYAQEDLDLFFTSVAQDIPTGTHPILHAIDGAIAPTSIANAGPESDLDFQISYPLIWPQNSILFQTDDPVYQANYTFSGFLNNFLDAIDGSYCSYSAFGITGNSPDLDPSYPNPAPGGYQGQLQCGVYKSTNVISISYGGGEADLPMTYQRRQCNEFMKLGLQGISTIVASGDWGVGQHGTDSCLGDDGKVFIPEFPATCPYLTSVGATVLQPGAVAGKDDEVAVSRFGSGGGFSNIYPQPEYQRGAVEDYFATANPPYPYYESEYNNSFAANGGIYNRAGRGYPDVAAIGDNVLVFNKGLPTLVGGTSASAPVFASMLTRINEERLAANRPTVGFVNPVLYAHPEVFHDVTQGRNPGCGTDGFAAAKGWDPVTGLGTPNYPKLLELFMR